MVNAVVDVPLVFADSVKSETFVEALLPRVGLRRPGQRVAVRGDDLARVFAQVLARCLHVGAEFLEVKLRAFADKDETDAAVVPQHRVQCPTVEALLELLGREKKRGIGEQ